MNSAVQKAVKNRKSYTLQQKMDIITAFKNGKSKATIAKENSMTKDSVKCIIKKKVEITQQFKLSNPTLKRTRESKFSEINKLTYDWFVSQRLHHIPLGSSMIKAKAHSFGKALGEENFTASNGWFEAFKKKYDISLKSICGEASSAPQASADSWLENKWPIIKAGFKADDIFNADETGLFFRMLPMKTYGIRNDRSPGLKQEKVRVTVLVCANMSGTEKQKLILIGKSKKPRKFPKDHGKLDVNYKSQKKSWMDSVIWEDYLRKWDAQLLKRKRRILLLVDNCTAHIDVPHLKCITVEYFPPNVTSLLQPCDQGIIKTLKSYYKRYMLEKLLIGLEQTNALIKIDLLEACSLVAMAWDSVTAETIRNCFRHARLLPEEEDVQILDEIREQNEAMYSELFAKLGIEQDEEDTMDAYTENDSELTTREPLPEPGQAVTNQDDEVILVEDEADDADEDAGEPVTTNSVEECTHDVFYHLSQVKQWIQGNGCGDDAVAAINSAERLVLERSIANRIQKKITDYFK